jgi:DNA-binding SARP family transcriptional activator
MIRFFAALRLMIIRLAVLTGIPGAMLAIAGPPWPNEKPSASHVQAYLGAPVSPDHAPATAWALAWATWGLVTVSVVGSTIKRARSRDWRQLWERVCFYLPSPLQGMMAGLVGTAAMATGPALPAHAASTTPATTSEDPQPVEAPNGGQHHDQTASAAGTGTPTSPDTVTVRRGDTLWRIAEHRLDDPARWPEIYRLNRGHQQTNGYTLTNPNKIHIGWTLALPAHDTTARPDAVSPAPPENSNGVTKPSPGIVPNTSPAPPTSNPPSMAAPSLPDSPTTSETSTRAPATTTATPAEDEPSTAGPVAANSGRGTSGSYEAGISLPSQGWVSLGLAALIAALAAVLRLQRRRRARLSFPIPTRITGQPTPIPAPIALVDAAGTAHLPTDDDEPRRPAAPAVPAPIGLDAEGSEVSLFDLPGPGLAFTGDGAESATRAVLAAALATGATQAAEAQPVVITTADLLARLLPARAALIGLDPDGTAYDGERLLVLADAAAAVTHAEEEMIVRRRLLDTFNLDTVTALNERTDHAETQPPYVLLIEATQRHAARLRAVGSHRPALGLHPVVLGGLDGLSTVEIAADGTTSNEAAGLARLSTLAAHDLAAVLAMLTDAAPRPEPGHDIDLDPDPSDPAAAGHEASAKQTEPVPAQRREAAAPVRLRVLGPVLLETPAGPVATGMRSGSYTVLASLAVHPGGRTLDQLAADLHPDTEPGTAGKRIRTDISTTRRVLRAATGNPEAMFVIYDPATGRYRLDAELIAVDLWQMLTAIEAANTTDDDTQALALLRDVVELYGGDFANGADQTWITDYATTYRHQILSVLARIAEILEPDHPDQAVAALERALQFDPVNEELYQRVMRIHGRAGRPDAVRRTLRRLEERLADLGDAEPSQATRRVANRQLRPATAASRGPR